MDRESIGIRSTYCIIALLLIPEAIQKVGFLYTLPSAGLENHLKIKGSRVVKRIERTLWTTSGYLVVFLEIFLIQMRIT